MAWKRDSNTIALAVPPKWKLEPSDQSVVIGDRVTFHCQANGYPLPLIRWKLTTGKIHEFKSISSNYHIQTLENGSLTIKEAAESDAGFYICEAGN
ncbi:Down syndrome cell adhesion molecule-like protein, partial [Leptotrombidium deliense]